MRKGLNESIFLGSAVVPSCAAQASSDRKYTDVSLYGDIEIIKLNVDWSHEIEVGSRWARADGSKGYVTVEGFEYYGSVNPYEWDVVYSWEEDGVKKTWQKEMFGFQCRYCLIIEELK